MAGAAGMVPKMAITVGPRETWMAEKVSIWHAGMHDNPLLEPAWTTPFGVPPFDRVQVSDLQPALEAGMANLQRHVENVLFGKATPAAAAKAMYDEAKAQIKS
mgnify:CR=1 FL=1